MERRSLPDRRRRPTSFTSCLRLGGQRKALRRSGETARAYVDHAMPWTVVLTLFVVIASAFDALFTLVHLQVGGAAEANPIMRFALEHGVGWFLVSKVSLTALGAWFLAAHQLFPLGFRSLRVLAVAYVVLLVYHTAIFIVR